VFGKEQESRRKLRIVIKHHRQFKCRESAGKGRRSETLEGTCTSSLTLSLSRSFLLCAKLCIPSIYTALFYQLRLVPNFRMSIYTVSLKMKMSIGRLPPLIAFFRQYLQHYAIATALTLIPRAELIALPDALACALLADDP